MTTGLERPYSNPGTQLLVCEDLHPPPQGWAPGPQDQSLCGQTAETRGGALCGKLGLAPVGTDACWPAHWGPLSGCLGWPSQMTAKTTERGSPHLSESEVPNPGVPGPHTLRKLSGRLPPAVASFRGPWCPWAMAAYLPLYLHGHMLPPPSSKATGP